MQRRREAGLQTRTNARMTVSARQGVTPTTWFLIARGGASTIRISPGLTLREDPASGELQVLSRQASDGWLRFEIEGDVLWVEVASPQWTLVAGKRRQAARWRLDGSVELVLPHHTFQISSSLAGTARAQCPQIRLQRRQPREDRQPREQRQPGHDQPPRQDKVVSLRARAAKRPTEPIPQRVAPITTDTRLKAPALRTEGRRTRPARRHRPAPRSGTTVLSTLLLLLAMVVSPQALNPTGNLAGAAGVTPAAMPAPGEPGTALLPQVERLLEANPDDPSSLTFAVAAYSVEALRDPGNRALAQRLEQLETQLADSTH